MSSSRVTPWGIFVCLLAFVSFAVAAEDQIILEGEGPIIIEDEPIHIESPWKRLVALNHIVRIESSPQHEIPAGAYFTTVVASQLPVHFNVTLGVAALAGKGVLIPAAGDVLTKRLHGQYPHPFAVFNTTVDLMGVYRLVVFIEDDTDVYVELVYQLKRAGLRAFQHVQIEPLRHEIVEKERSILLEEQDKKKEDARRECAKWMAAEKEKWKLAGEEETEEAAEKVKEMEAIMREEEERLDQEAEIEYSELLMLQGLREREARSVAGAYADRLHGEWGLGFTEAELEAWRLEIKALAERIRLWGRAQHARLRKAYVEEIGELERLGAMLSGAYDTPVVDSTERGAEADDSGTNHRKNKGGMVELAYYQRIRQYAKSRLGHYRHVPEEWHEPEVWRHKPKHSHGKEAHNVTVVSATHPFKVLPPTQCNGAPWYKSVKCDDCVSALRFQCAWCDTLNACVMSDGVGPLDRHACPEFHMQQCIVEGSRIMVIVPLVVGGCLILLLMASCLYCERDVKRRARQRQKRFRELNHVHSDSYPAYGTIVQRE